MNLSNARKNAADLIQTALDKRIEELKQTEEFAILKKEIQDFEDNGSKNLWIDESGCLVTRERIFLDRVLCQDEDGNGDSELAESILKECSDSLHFTQDDYSQGYFEWVMETSYGEPVIFNELPERNCYAIFSHDLELKVDKVIDNEHGLILIEQAMRKHGFFPDVVSTGACGDAFHVSFPASIRNATDEQLTEMLRVKENSEES